MFRFIMPFDDGTVLNIAIGAKDVDAAFHQFRIQWWNCGMSRAIGVWHNAALTHRVLPIYDQGKDEMDCFLQTLSP